MMKKGAVAGALLVRVRKRRAYAALGEGTSEGAASGAAAAAVPRFPCVR